MLENWHRWILRFDVDTNPPYKHVRIENRTFSQWYSKQSTSGQDVGRPKTDANTHNAALIDFLFQLWPDENYRKHL